MLENRPMLALTAPEPRGPGPRDRDQLEAEPSPDPKALSFDEHLCHERRARPSRSQPGPQQQQDKAPAPNLEGAPGAKQPGPSSQRRADPEGELSASRGPAPQQPPAPQPVASGLDPQGEVLDQAPSAPAPVPTPGPLSMAPTGWQDAPATSVASVDQPTGPPSSMAAPSPSPAEAGQAQLPNRASPALTEAVPLGSDRLTADSGRLDSAPPTSAPTTGAPAVAQPPESQAPVEPAEPRPGSTVADRLGSAADPRSQAQQPLPRASMVAPRPGPTLAPPAAPGTSAPAAATPAPEASPAEPSAPQLPEGARAQRAPRGRADPQPLGGPGASMSETPESMFFTWEFDPGANQALSRAPGATVSPSLLSQLAEASRQELPVTPGAMPDEVKLILPDPEGDIRLTVGRDQRELAVKLEVPTGLISAVREAEAPLRASLEDDGYQLQDYLVSDGEAEAEHSSGRERGAADHRRRSRPTHPSGPVEASAGAPSSGLHLLNRRA